MILYLGVWAVLEVVNDWSVYLVHQIPPTHWQADYTQLLN